MERLDIRQPRTFGYQIGDKFARVLTLQLRKPYRLVVAALPAQGKLSQWLVIEAPQLVQQEVGAATLYEIRLTYQIVNIHPELQDIAVPHHYLRYSDGHTTGQALIPATRVGVSVVHKASGGEFQPDHPPWSLRFPYVRPILFGCLFLSALLGVASLHWGFPLLTQPRPFTQACRRLRHLRQTGDDSTREALLIIHQAFNATAGRTVFADALAEFFAAHGRFAPLRQPITEFFLRSRQVFYGGLAESQAPQYSRAELAVFAQRCSDFERGLG